MNFIKYIIKGKRIHLKDYDHHTDYFFLYIIHLYGFNVTNDMPSDYFRHQFNDSEKPIDQLLLREPFINKLYESAVWVLEHYDNIYKYMKNIVDLKLDVYYKYDKNKSIYQYLNDKYASHKTYQKVMKYINDYNNTYNHNLNEIEKIEIVLVETEKSKKS